MSRWEIWALHATALVLLVTGLAIGLSKYVLVNDDPFSVVGSPYEPWALAVHVVTAPLLIFLIGYIFRRHVMTKLKDPRQEGDRTGLAVVALFVALVVSGYLLQVQPW